MTGKVTERETNVLKKEGSHVIVEEKVGGATISSTKPRPRHPADSVIVTNEAMTKKEELLMFDGTKKGKEKGWNFKAKIYF